ncbi:MAG TPA: nucleotide pyrophosphohydrolase [Euryarchaeota archaeon]|nr:nucleotide pyrophosphohydrolase [Euryarchaeota archaeon]
MNISDAQKAIYEEYYERDSERGIDGTFRWFVEEIGELAKAIRGEGDLEEEIADVFAWLLSIANLLGIDVERAFMKKYGFIFGGEKNE